MSLVSNGLDNAILEIDPLLRQGFPKFKETVIETTKPAVKNKELWHFSTNKKRIRAYLYKPTELAQIFRKVNTRFYRRAYPDGLNLEMLVQDNKLSLLFHEQFHKLCPETSTDERKIDEAIYSAISKECQYIPDHWKPNLVANSRNCVWDCIIDLFQYYYITYDAKFKRILSEQLRPENRLPEGIIPLFDIVSTFKEKKWDMAFYTLTRLMYASLFCNDFEIRNRIYSYFADKMDEQNCTAVVCNAVKGFISEIDDKILRWLEINRNDFNEEVDQFYNNLDSQSSEKIIKDLFQILQRTQTRYAAVEGFVRPLASHISLYKPCDRPFTAHSSQTSALDNLIQYAENQAETILFTANSGTSVSFQAADEFYKQNRKIVNLTIPKLSPVQHISGQEIQWRQTGIQNISAKDAGKYNLRQIIAFGRQIGKKNVIILNNGKGYRIIKYKQKTKNKYATRQAELDIDIVRNLVLLVDASSSMHPFSYVGSKSKYDALNRFVYGIVEPLAKYCGGKDCDIVTARFSDKTVIQGPCNIRDFYNTLHPVKVNILAGHGGSTELEKGTFKRINKMLAKGRTLWTLITDGDVLRQQGLKAEMYEVLKQKDHSMLYIELYDASCCGRSLKHKDLTYLPIKSFDEINQEKVLNLMLEIKNKTI
ncbi:hypothetical protein KY338_03985 [Candidatus Woesearchaeota archaeon]|nr:hypothetical protein [Candidatus Woesearchaeota archaeon]MBW3005473.1 hypothetical protein [Candidatus Woesearchaeota archaeon]